MKVELNIDPNIKEETVCFMLKALTPKMEALIENLNRSDQSVLVGYIKDEITLLDLNEIVLFYTEAGKVYAKNDKGLVFLVKQRLYELEENLSKDGFIRIANSALANANKIRKLKMSVGGSMGIVFKDGTTEFASRRCISKIKNYLGL